MLLVLSMKQRWCEENMVGACPAGFGVEVAGISWRWLELVESRG